MGEHHFVSLAVRAVFGLVHHGEMVLLDWTVQKELSKIQQLAGCWRDPCPLPVGYGICSGEENHTGVHTDVKESIAWAGTHEHEYMVGVEGV